MENIKIKFWTVIAIILDLRPRIAMPKHYDYPIAYTDITKDDKYTYPEGTTVLYEYDKGDRHNIIYLR